MSDAKAKRPVRDSARNEPAAADRPAEAAAAPAIAPHPVAEPETPAVAPETAGPPPPAAPIEAMREPTAAAADDAWTAVAAAQTALARACEAVAVEVGGLTRSGIAAGNDAALALLGARTIAEAVEINAVWARRGFDTMVEGSARLSEIGVKAMTEASQPMLSRLFMPWGEGSAG